MDSVVTCDRCGMWLCWKSLMGALGIIAPDHFDGPLEQNPRLYFTDEFLHGPPAFWEVSPVFIGTEKRRRFARGTLVKCNYEKLPIVWELTGRDFPLTTCHVYEAKWPD
jgi:hypothetical protein